MLCGIIHVSLSRQRLRASALAISLAISLCIFASFIYCLSRDSLRASAPNFCIFFFFIYLSLTRQPESFSPLFCSLPLSVKLSAPLSHVVPTYMIRWCVCVCVARAMS